MGGRHVDNLVESDRAEVGKLDFHNGLLAHDGGPGHHAGHGVLTDGGVNHPVREQLLEALGRFECAAENAYVLPVQKDVPVFRKQVFLGVVDGINVCYAHGNIPFAGLIRSPYRGVPVFPEGVRFRFPLSGGYGQLDFIGILFFQSRRFFRREPAGCQQPCPPGRLLRIP